MAHEIGVIKEVPEFLKWIWRRLTQFAGVIFIIGICYGGWTAVDEAGLVKHNETTTITVPENWMVGESKMCSSPVLNTQEAANLNQSGGYAMSVVVCGDYPTKMFKIAFYGRTNQPEYDGVQWSCVSNELSWSEDAAFTCKETAGFHARDSPSR